MIKFTKLIFGFGVTINNKIKFGIHLNNDLTPWYDSEIQSKPIWFGITHSQNEFSSIKFVALGLLGFSIITKR